MLKEHGTGVDGVKSLRFHGSPTQAVDVQHGVPAKARYKETFEALEIRYGDHQLTAEYHSQLKAELHLVGPARV
jgi:hypothetical protein